jgi:hypothetical protein
VASLAPAAAPSGSTDAPAAPFGRKLRVGVVADSPLQPRWLVESLARVAASDFAELVWVAINGVRDDFPSGKSSLTPFIWRAYRALDERLFGAGEWSRPVDVMSIVAPSRRLRADAITQAAPVDAVIALGNVPDEAIAGHATCGVWRYCFGAEQGICEPLAGVGEVLEASAVIASGLRVHLGQSRDRLVYQSWSRTIPFSVARSRDNLFAKTTEFLPRALRELHRNGPAWLDRIEIVPGTISPEIVPGTISAARMAMRVADRAFDKLATVEQWSLAFRFVDIEPWTGSLDGFHRLDAPRDGFWADPFPLQRDGKSYIFFEELPSASAKAHISVIEVDRDGHASRPVRVIERDYHLSYPFLIEDEGQLYMVPESAANRTIEIYRCVDFPHQWRRERVLVDGIFAADATLHRAADGRWWMFAAVGANGAEIHDELHVFTSESLLGEWKPLAANPVKSDVRGARPAGKLFTQAGRLYRPAQICAPLYGTGIALQRVTRLDDDYAEEEERRILPPAGQGVLGMHTINRAGDLSVTDAFVRRSRLRLTA